MIYRKKIRKTCENSSEQSIVPSIRVPKVGFESVSIENLHVTLYISGFQNKPNFCILLDVPTEKFGRLINIPKNRTKERNGKTKNKTLYSWKI